MPDCHWRIMRATNLLFVWQSLPKLCYKIFTKLNGVFFFLRGSMEGMFSPIYYSTLKSAPNQPNSKSTKKRNDCFANSRKWANISRRVFQLANQFTHFRHAKRSQNVGKVFSSYKYTPTNNVLTDEMTVRLGSQVH